MTASRRIVPRAEWGAVYGRGNDCSSKLPWNEVVVHTEAGGVRPQDWLDLGGLDLASVTERQHVRNVERYHAVTRGWQGIGYSFFITFDGTIFEGRGWGRTGAHTEGRNSTAAGVCLQGHGDLQEATPAQWAALRWLIGEGIRLDHLTPSPRIGSHHEYSKKGKTCCGLKIRPHLGQLRGITGPTRKDTLTMGQYEELKADIARIDGELQALELRSYVKDTEQDKALANSDLRSFAKDTEQDKRIGGR